VGRLAWEDLPLVLLVPKNFLVVQSMAFVVRHQIIAVLTRDVSRTLEFARPASHKMDPEMELGIRKTILKTVDQA
jgi:hypothetical protein